MFGHCSLIFHDHRGIDMQSVPSTRASISKASQLKPDTQQSCSAPVDSLVLALGLVAVVVVVVGVLVLLVSAGVVLGGTLVLLVVLLVHAASLALGVLAGLVSVVLVLAVGLAELVGLATGDTSKHLLGEGVVDDLA